LSNKQGVAFDSTPLSPCGDSQAYLLVLSTSVTIAKSCFNLNGRLRRGYVPAMQAFHQGLASNVGGMVLVCGW
jgi:hypothetical protein